MNEQDARYVLKPRPPVRAFVIAAIATLVGAIMMAACRHSAFVLVALSALVMALGIALAVMAGISMVRMRTFVELSDEGYRITGPGTDRQGSWAEVTKVTTSANGAHLTFHHGEVGRTHILCPGGGDDEQMQALVADVAKHLDTDRGYGPPINL